MTEDNYTEENDDDLALNLIREFTRNSSIDTLIQQTLEGLCASLVDNTEINVMLSFTEYKKQIRAGKISYTYIVNVNFNSMVNTKISEREDSIVLDCLIALACSEIALENHAIMMAWSLLSRARFKYGLYCGLTDPQKSSHAERGRLIAEQRTKNAAEEYELLLQLMHNLKPPRGWRSKPDAAEKVGKALFERKLKEGKIIINSNDDKQQKENDHIGLVLNSIIANKDIEEIYKSKS